MWRSVITGTGSYIATVIKKNDDFSDQRFYAEDGYPLAIDTPVFISRFQEITGIRERRYTAEGIHTSQMATSAAVEALKDSRLDKENLDMIIVAHNFGEVDNNRVQEDTLPSLANRVKHQLKISNPDCIAFDVIFGCPGWLLGIMQADAFFKAGMAKNALVIGSETLSKVIDFYDRDSMLYSDGAGAIVLEYKQVTEEKGILSSCAQSHSKEELYYLEMNHSYFPQNNSGVKYMKMKGKKVYEYALKNVPPAMKSCLDSCGIDIREIKKIFIHQANEKMIEAIVQQLYKLYGIAEVPENVLPMCIHYLGNSSVATIPTLFDLVCKGMDPGHYLERGDPVLFASVGAGMNINAICYRL